MMHTKSSSAESFLTEFHNARPGLTSKAFGSLPVIFGGREFSSSYDVLASVVPHADTCTDVLDLACGEGFLLSLLASRGPSLQLCGADMNFAELEAAKARLSSAATLVQARAQGLPFGRGTFDFVLCHLALMLMEDAEEVLREIGRVLKPGAVLAAIVSATSPATFALTAYLEALARHPRRSTFSEIRFGDRRLRTRDGIRQMLSPAFRNIAIDEIHIARRLTPDELWLWFRDMYDLYLLDEDHRSAVEHEYLSKVAARCDADGKLEYVETLRYFGARAA